MGLLAAFGQIAQGAKDAGLGVDNLTEATLKYDAAAAKAAASADNLKTKLAAIHASSKDVAQSMETVALNTQLATDAQNGNASSIQAGIAVQGQGTIMNLTLAKATKEQSDALDELLKRYNMFGETVEHTMSIAAGWKDYLAELKSSYDQGGLSILSYKQALEDFETQLVQTFAGATGKAKEGLTSMLGVIRELIATAGAGGGGPAGSPGAAGLLEHEFNKKP